MAITIDWGTKVINIPKADMLLVQAMPTEIRELNLDTFRLALKDLEDSEDGMPFPKTHNHVAPITVSGVQLARVIELLDPYTVTFEDGQYAVNLIGANSNVADKVNVNQVSVRSANSAGLVQTREIEYSSFNNCVTIDAANGRTGTGYPNGTPAYPVNNLTDAMFIAQLRGFSNLSFIGNFTFTTGTYISNMSLYGQGMQKSTFTFQNGSIVAYCKAYSAKLTGQVLGIVGFQDCHLYNYGSSGLVPSSSTVIATHCLIEGTLTLPSNFAGKIYAVDCWGVPNATVPPVIDMGNGNFEIQIRNYSGVIGIKNSTHASNDIRVFLNSGAIILFDSITAGYFRLSGVGALTDNTTSNVNLTVDTTSLVNTNMISAAVENEIGAEIQYASFNTPDGSAVTFDANSIYSGTAYPVGSPLAPVNNIEDALLIAVEHGFKVIQILSDLTISDGIDVSEFMIVSDNFSHVEVEAGSITTDTVFKRVDIDGVLSGSWNILIDCWVNTITNFTGWLRGGSFTHITLAPYTPTIPPSEYALGQSFFDNIVPMYPAVNSTIVCNTDTSVALTTTDGYINVENLTVGSIMTIGLNSGKLTIADSCTGGDIDVSGTGILEDNSTGSTVNQSSFLSLASIADAVADGDNAEVLEELNNIGKKIDDTQVFVLAK